MKRVKSCLAFGVILTLLFAACGTTQTGGELTNVPVATKAPEVTETPTSTETPGNAETTTVAPEITEELVTTAVPEVTEIPVTTEVPKATATPTLTVTPRPTATPEPTATPKPTATPTPTKIPYPKADSSKGDICYRYNELKVVATDGVDYITNADAMTLRFDETYGQIRLLFPAAVDTSQCTGISIKMKANDTWICVAYYEESFVERPLDDETEIFARFVEIEEDVEVQSFNVPDMGYIYGIALTYFADENIQGKYEAVVENITFHMLSGNVVNIPKDIAPDVTDDMTLLNTYGTLVENVGTCVFLPELQNPAVVQELKKHYNCVNCGEGAALDIIISKPVELLSVEEAQKMGYIIPKDYKEKVVPRLSFDLLDETLELCAKNDFKYVFQTFFWYEADQILEEFFRTDYTRDGKYVRPEVMNARVEFYIRNVMNHVYNGKYGDIVYAWVVMNEHLHGNAENSVWLKVYGDCKFEPEFLKHAYTVADDVLKKYGVRDNTALILNEYDTYFIKNERDMTQDLLTVMAYINSDGMVCDTIGMQSHMDTTIPIKGKQKKAVQAFLDAGYAVQFTEAEVTIPTSEAGKEAQEKYYCEFMEMVLEFARKGEKITGLSFWGSGDSISWLKEFSPLMFTHLGRPKDAYYKVLQTYLDPDRIPKEETVDITYGCDELNYVLDYVADYTINQDGAMDLAFQDQYQEIMFKLPEAIDMKQCVGITVKAKSEYSDLTVKLYGEEWLTEPFSNPVYQYDGCLGDGILDYDVLLQREATVYGIGFMSLHKVEDFSKFKATIYSVTFHMKPGYQAE
ncbi:MAG: endo-1,4-beta-xylanase [Lachnospiraceae bacterium]|nr:endo-1,4-beta-xylanase [Lachnospiraceae bacterium]